MNNKYVEALNNGAEVVIVSANPADNSAIYWKRGGNYFRKCKMTLLLSSSGGREND